MIKSSCRGCTDRHLGCHSTCEKYKKFRKEWDEMKAEERAENIADWPSCRRLLGGRKQWWKKLKHGRIGK